MTNESSGPHVPPVIYDAKRGGFYDTKDGHRMTDGELAEYRKNNPPQELPGMLAVAKGIAEQKWPHTMDAKVWADEFAKVFPMLWKEGGAVTDVADAMLGWFANAIMAGYDTAQSRQAAPPEEVRPVATDGVMVVLSNGASWLHKDGAWIKQ